jgi:hypothetical protein
LKALRIDRTSSPILQFFCQPPDDQIKEIEKLLGSEEFQSSEHRDILTNTLDTLREAQRGEWSDSFDVLEQARSNFYTHLERNSGSEILLMIVRLLELNQRHDQQN